MEEAFARAAQRQQDCAAAEVVPPLGRWRAPVLATHALVSGRPLDEVSVQDYPSDEFGDNRFIAGGYGAFFARLAAGLPIALQVAVRELDWSAEGVTLRTEGGAVRAGSAIVTVPVAVLAAAGIRFRPALPVDLSDAIAGFLPGTYEHVVMNWPGSPMRGADRLAKLVGRRSVGMMTWMDGAPFHYMELDHPTASGLRDAGAAAGLARDVLAEHFGARALGTLRVLAATAWHRDPWSLCGWAVIPPGRHAARAGLRMPVAERMWFAGEATSESQWGTVGGAWEEGERAARSVIQTLRPGAICLPGEGPVSCEAETP